MHPSSHPPQGGLWRRLWRALTEPSSALTKPDDRRCAQFLSVGTILALISLLLHDAAHILRGRILAAGAALLVGAYVLSRTRYYRGGASLAVLALSGAPLAALIVRAQWSTSVVTATLAWMVLAVLLSSLTLPTTWTAALLLLNLAALVTLPLLITTLPLAAVMPTLGLVGAVGVLALVGNAFGQHYLGQSEVRAGRLAVDEARFRRLVEGAPEMVAVHSGGRMQYINEAGVRVFGVASAEELIGRLVVDFVHPDHREQVAERQRQAERGEPQEMMEERIIRANGKVADVEIISIPTTYEGQPAVQMVIRDITERKRMEEEVRRLKELNESIVQNMAEGIVIEDAEGFFTFVNPAAASMLGYRVEELLGQHWTRVTPPDQHPIVHAADQRRQRGQSDRYELELVRKDGTRLAVQVSGSPRFAEGRFVGTLAVFTDISEMRRARETLQAAYEALQEVDRLKTIMIQNVSHEFRTPLTYIVGYVGLLLDEAQDMGPLTEEQRRSLTIIAEQAQRLRHLMDRFVAMERVSEGALDLQQSDLAALIERSVEAAQLLATNARLTLTQEVAASLPPVRVDVLAVQQVLENLLSNAIKFTPAGGRVTVRAWASGAWVYVAVADTGIGIPPEEQERIFERFYQVDGSPSRRYAGVGLGLAICKQTVEAHGGRIWVESQPGQGSTFTFTLPI